MFNGVVTVPFFYDEARQVVTIQVDGDSKNEALSGFHAYEFVGPDQQFLGVSFVDFRQSDSGTLFIDFDKKSARIVERLD